MDNSLPISALQHFLFCPRQCALIHLERQWVENTYTAKGRVFHERTDSLVTGNRRGVRTITSMPIRSTIFNIHGVADVVEFHKGSLSEVPYPVEYKRGKPKLHRADEVQLCAQVLCLEEMFDVIVAKGALFYGDKRRRTIIAIDSELRAETERIIADTRFMFKTRTTPPPLVDQRPCRHCSMREICQPALIGKSRSAGKWFLQQLGS